VRLLWRISNHNDLEGIGGERSDGRWHTAARGKRIVYLSEHPALALIEALANLKGNARLFPDRYQLLKVNAANDASSRILHQKALSESWRDNLEETRALGDEWLANVDSTLLIVPSAPAPESSNYLFNPLHPSATQISIEWSKQLEYDKRLFHSE
jgi:RES domain-containing protein